MVAGVIEVTVIDLVADAPLPHKFRGVTVIVPPVAANPKTKLLDGVVVVAVNVTPVPE